jgi:hypothetical protein
LNDPFGVAVTERLVHAGRRVVHVDFTVDGHRAFAAVVGRPGFACRKDQGVIGGNRADGIFMGRAFMESVSCVLGNSVESSQSALNH